MPAQGQNQVRWQKERYIGFFARIPAIFRPGAALRSCSGWTPCFRRGSCAGQSARSGFIREDFYRNAAGCGCIPAVWPK